MKKYYFAGIHDLDCGNFLVRIEALLKIETYHFHTNFKEVTRCGSYISLGFSFITSPPFF